MPTPTLIPTFRCRLSRFLARPQPINTECVEIVFQGWRAKVLRHPRRGTSERARRAISLRNDRSGRVATCCGRAFPHFHASTRPIHQSIDPATKHGIFATNDAKALKALRTLRPTLCELCGPHYLIAGTMALSGMTVLSMDEILLRTEISRMRKEGTRRRASERARHGHGRDKCGPPATGTAAQTLSPPSALGVRAGGVPRPSPCRPTASRDMLHRRATSPRTYSRTPPRDAAPSQDEISPRNNLRSRRAARRDTFGRNELRPP